MNKLSILASCGDIVNEKNVKNDVHRKYIWKSLLSVKLQQSTATYLFTEIIFAVVFLHTMRVLASKFRIEIVFWMKCVENRCLWISFWISGNNALKWHENFFYFSIIFSYQQYVTCHTGKIELRILRKDLGPGSRVAAKKNNLVNPKSSSGFLKLLEIVQVAIAFANYFERFVITKFSW